MNHSHQNLLNKYSQLQNLSEKKAVTIADFKLAVRLWLVLKGYADKFADGNELKIHDKRLKKLLSIELQWFPSFQANPANFIPDTRLFYYWEHIYKAISKELDQFFAEYRRNAITNQIIG